MKYIKKGFLLILSLISYSCNSAPAVHQNSNAPISHEEWSLLLQKYVTEDGHVNYAGFQKDSLSLNKYLKRLSENAPNDSWTKNDQKAYWINAYNAFTIQLIIRHYPLASIKDIGSKIQVPYVNSPWDIKFVRIGSHIYDLNMIEHGILRENFNDPRIHFAIVCASGSCPLLLNTAYEAADLDVTLNKQAKAFITDPSRNIISANHIQISEILSWFEGDFTKNGTLIDYLNTYSKVRISRNAKISYLPYNWNLNK